MPQSRLVFAGNLSPKILHAKRELESAKNWFFGLFLGQGLCKVYSPMPILGLKVPICFGGDVVTRQCRDSETREGEKSLKSVEDF